MERFRGLRFRVLRGGGVGLVVLALLLGGCSGAGETGAVLASPGQEGAGEPAGSGSFSAPTLASPPPSAKPQSLADAARRKADAQLKASAQALKNKAYFTMPKLVGEDLQAARVTLQARGSFLLSQTDASAAHRAIAVSLEWKVCTQSPKAGTKVLLVKIVKLTAVKLAESCPK